MWASVVGGRQLSGSLSLPTLQCSFAAPPAECRLVVQALVAQRLLQAPLLPGVAVQLAQAVLALSLISFPGVASQLPGALRASKGAAAAKAAA